MSCFYRSRYGGFTISRYLCGDAKQEQEVKYFLRNTISDISHQLKTPLAALNVYDGILQDSAGDLETVREFTELSEQELDRIEGLVSSLLKVAKLDAGSVAIHLVRGEGCAAALRPAVAQIAVKHDGSGMHPQDIHHIFKRFYRSRFFKDTQGVGLSLPLAKEIVEAHGGVITVDSALGEGSLFLISFLNVTGS